MKSRLAILFLMLVGYAAAAQRFSIATDLSVMRQSGKEPNYFGLVQVIQPSYALGNKVSVYLSIGNSSAHNTERSFVTQSRNVNNPATTSYTANTSWRTRQFSGGWKQYITGGYKTDRAVGLYFLAGVGVMSVKLNTEHSKDVDTTAFKPLFPYPGGETLNRLSFDAGLGIEKSLTPNFYLYFESKAWLHRDDFSSPYMLEKNVTILPVMFGAGLRVLFGYFP